jgi:hypothetical protein
MGLIAESEIWLRQLLDAEDATNRRAGTVAVLEGWALFRRGASAVSASAAATPAESRAIGRDHPLSDRHDEETGARVSGTTGPRIVKSATRRQFRKFPEDRGKQKICEPNPLTGVAALVAAHLWNRVTAFCRLVRANRECPHNRS